MPSGTVEPSGDGPAAVEPPSGFVWPRLDPTGIELRTIELGRGVFALLSGQVSVNNGGFVVGDDGVLVIDAHINGPMARQVQAAIARITSRPIRYLVNTNHHGDHTFGNHAFAPEVRIVAHRTAAALMRGFERERQFLSRTVRDPAVLAEVRFRPPDLELDSTLRIDLGGQVVELHHFGHGNSPGDVVVYAPSADVAWTGNLTLGHGMIPFVLHGRAADYLQTTARFAATLSPTTIVAGHGGPTGASALGRDLGYLVELLRALRRAVVAGRSAAAALDDFPLPAALAATATEGYQRDLIEGFHRWNVARTHALLAGA